MNIKKLLQLTFRVSLIALLLSGYSKIDAQPRSGDWSVATDFGQFAFTVHPDLTKLTKCSITYSSFTCGNATKNGTIASTGSWPISNNQFTYEYKDFFSNDIMTIKGTFDNTGEVSGTWSSIVGGTTCSGNWGPAMYLQMEIDSGIPGRYVMAQNYPNPFNPNTTIYYSLPNESAVTITVYDILGEEINQLVSQKQPSGKHSIQWNGKDNLGQLVSGGVYLYSLQTGDFTQTKKMVLLR